MYPVNTAVNAQPMRKGAAMMIRFAEICRKNAIGFAVAAFATLGSAPFMSQSIETADPDMAIDADLSQPAGSTSAAATSTYQVEAPSSRYDQANNR